MNSTIPFDSIDVLVTSLTDFQLVLAYRQAFWKSDRHNNSFTCKDKEANGRPGHLKCYNLHIVSSELLALRYTYLLRVWFFNITLEIGPNKWWNHTRVILYLFITFLSLRSIVNKTLPKESCFKNCVVEWVVSNWASCSQDLPTVPRSFCKSSFWSPPGWVLAAPGFQQPMHRAKTQVLHNPQSGAWWLAPRQLLIGFLTSLTPHLSTAFHMTDLKLIILSSLIINSSTAFQISNPNLRSRVLTSPVPPGTWPWTAWDLHLNPIDCDTECWTRQKREFKYLQLFKQTGWPWVSQHFSA